MTPIGAARYIPRTPAAPTTGAPAGFAAGVDAFGLRGVPDFHAAGDATTASRLKDGTNFTPDLVTYYNGILWWAANETAATALLDNDYLYDYGRSLKSAAEAMLQAFRFTGDLRLLDKVADFLDGIGATLAVPWRTGYNTSLWDSSDWSPYDKWVVNGAFGDYSWTDIGTGATMNWAKTSAWILEATYALELNRDLTSPAGGATRYATAADTWKDWLLNHFRPAWQGGGTTAWRANYTGLRYPTRRAGDTDFPFVYNPGDSHSTVSAIAGMHYWWALFGNVYARNGRDRLQTGWRDTELRALAGDVGTNVVWTHGFTAEGSPSGVLQPITYVEYQLADMMLLWLAGFDPAWTAERMRQPWRSMNEYVVQADGSLLGDIGGQEPKAGLAVSPDASPRTATQATAYAYGQGLAFAPDRCVNIFDTNQTTYGNGYANPTYVQIPTGMFMREALLATDVL